MALLTTPHALLIAARAPGAANAEANHSAAATDAHAATHATAKAGGRARRCIRTVDGAVAKLVAVEALWAAAAAATAAHGVANAELQAERAIQVVIAR